jgi:signal peptidase I
VRRPLRFVVFGSAVAAAVIAQPYRVVMVDGGSMSPTYESGNLVLTSRLGSGIRHGDVVVFKHEGETFVKRVAFLPGDRILQFKFEGNWTVPNNDYVVQTLRRHKTPMRFWAIPDGQIFVIGDNFCESVDSRSFGTIPLSNVLGTVTDPPRPELIQGFAGTKVFDDDSTRLAVRTQPLTGKDAQRAREYVASLERRKSGRRTVNSEQ